MKGLFITLEGGEGAGKSTQVERLSRRLRDSGRETVVTREPGGSPRAELIRASILAGEGKAFGPLAEALMFSAARADHVETVIRPALARGAVVLCDRFADSTRAYQGSRGEVDEATLRALERVVVGATKPNLTLILDLPADIGLTRAAARRREGRQAADRFEQEDIDFHARLREAFLAIARAEPERCAVIDARGEPGQVADEIWRTIRERVGVKTLLTRP
ncbi:dTMP kinase [Salinarimonas soli]|uniref:Thymidylate kinase n=1 Tax=Salinarimonas soli TaxID=1638099 RepID=A0A5B2VSD8_9HYPH|nr:dTMP kinase [Salinarimonas soli]KAA2241117.1 dTMP kinase [Salinarimonas soli]